MRRYLFIAITAWLAQACSEAPRVDASPTGGQTGGNSGISAGGTETETSTSGAMPPSSTGQADDSETSASTGSSDEAGPKLDVGAPVDPPSGLPKTCEEAAQARTSVGCHFFGVGLPSDPYDETGLAVVNVSDELAHVTLQGAAGELEAAEVEPGAKYTFVIPHDAKVELETGISDLGVEIASDQVLQVFAHFPLSAGVTNDAGLILPEAALGDSHRIATYNGGYQIIEHDSQYLAVVATQDGTEVTVTASPTTAATSPGWMIPALGNGTDAFTTSLDKYEVLVVSAPSLDETTGTWTNEITGSLVESTAPVAVYAGADSIYLPGPKDQDTFVCCADRIAEATPPTAVWGTEYAGVKFLPLADEPDIWRFVADTDGTQISVDGISGGPFAIELAAGEYYELHTAENFWATGSEAFGLVHYMTSASAGYSGKEPVKTGEKNPVPTYDCGPIANLGDPAMTWAYPRGNWLSAYSFPVGLTAVPQAQWCHDHVNVVAQLSQWDLISIDGEVLPEPEPLADSEYGFARVEVPHSLYTIAAPEGVAMELTVYGYVRHGSYVFPGGVGLETLNPSR